MATGIPGVDHPEAREPVDVYSASRGDALTSFVEDSGNGPLLLTVPLDRSGRRVRLDVGENVQLVWKGPEGLRALPAELTEVLPGEEPRWQVKPMGPSTRGQRRNAVRAPMFLPVEVVSGQTQLIGETIDVSEGGLRCLFQPDDGRSTREHHAAAAAPSGAGGTGQTTAGEAATEGGGADAAPAGGNGRVELLWGTQVEVSLSLGGQEESIRSKAEVVRLHPRTDRRIEASLRFVGLAERDEDRIRARVFTELRVLRSRGFL